MTARIAVRVAAPGGVGRNRVIVYTLAGVRVPIGFDPASGCDAGESKAR